MGKDQSGFKDIGTSGFVEDYLANGAFEVTNSLYDSSNATLVVLFEPHCSGQKTGQQEDT